MSTKKEAINEVFNQAEIGLMLRGLQSFKEQQESEQLQRQQHGWNTEIQQATIESLDDIEERLFEFIY